jgi:hypothetical protein
VSHRRKTAASEELTDAVAVMDPFHVVRLAGDALDRLPRRRAYRDGSGVVTGIVGTLFAVSIGLVVVAAWNQVNTATGPPRTRPAT